MLSQGLFLLLLRRSTVHGDRTYRHSFLQFVADARYLQSQFPRRGDDEHRRRPGPFLSHVWIFSVIFQRGFDGG